MKKPTKKSTAILTFLCAAFFLCSCGITTVSISGSSLTGHQSSYFDHYHSRNGNGVHLVEGTVYQSAQDNNAVIAEVCAQEDSTLLVTGTMERREGDLQLVYTDQDGTQTLIADTNETSINMEISIPQGKGAIHFKNTGERAVCDFIFELQGDGHVLTSELNTQKTETAAFPHVKDNWPEDITFVHDGIYADTLTSTIKVDEPMSLSISCVTEDGLVDMKILRPDGKVCFDESDIQTTSYTTALNQTGEFQIVFHLEYHVGNIVIKPVQP